MLQFVVRSITRVRVAGWVALGLLAVAPSCSSSFAQGSTITEPKIQWATPAAIPAGTALGALQLNATANVDGTFQYEPAPGTVFRAAGTHTLSVIFTPKDASTYKSVRATTQLVVGRTFYVSPTGNDSASGQTEATPFATLQKAADSTAPGDFVYVMNGTYANARNSYTLLGIARPGTPNAWITYEAYKGARPVLVGNAATWDVVRFLNTAAYVALSGMTVIGNDIAVTLAQAQANKDTPAAHPETNGSCITVNGNNHTGEIYPHHIRISNNSVGNCPGGGIGTTYADYVTIAHNKVYGNAFYSAYGNSGISTLANFDSNPADTATKYKMVIEGNVLYANEELVAVAGSKPPQITDGEGIIIDSTNNSAYAGSGLTNPPYSGRTLVANNVIFNNGSAAIEVFQSSHVDVLNNSTYLDVTNPPVTGRGEMNLNVASDVNVVDNIFYSSPAQNPVTMNTACAKECVFDYNIYYGGKTVFLGTAAGAHDLVADPLYVAPGILPQAVNFRLRAGSPAIGSGTSMLAPAEDIEGKPRPKAGVDRGAYQR
jgi:hypothetical protein